MSDINEVKVSKVEQKRIRGRNHFDVVNQISTKYNSSQGWSVLKVVPNLLTIEVIVERSTDQATEVDLVDNKEALEVEVEKPEVEVEVKKAEPVVVVEKPEVEVEKATKATKKNSSK